MTWKDIKIATLQKMAAAEGAEIPSDDSVTDYLAAMPQAANEALLLLSTASKFIVKSVSVAHNPIANIIANGEEIRSSEGGTIEYDGDDAKSFYFEAFGSGVANIYVDNVPALHIILDNKKSYSAYKGLIDNPDGKNVRIEFVSMYPFAVKNVALYRATYETMEDVLPFTEVIKYTMKSIAEDFYMLDSEQIYFEGDNNTHRYIKASDYFQEGNAVLVLPRDMPGNYTIYYKAYPAEITKDTLDDYELPIDREVAALLPLYMASQIYKDDEIGIATSYRNEFEVARDALSNKPSVQSAEIFASESGWF